MKKILTGFAIGLLIVVMAGSCKKDTSVTRDPLVERKVRFQLYTNQDFSGDNSVIRFSLFIRDEHRTLFDSAIAPMQIKDIPDGTNKLVFEKTILTGSRVDIAAGFQYQIQNVGVSWFLDTSKAGNPFKLIDYAFR